MTTTTPAAARRTTTYANVARVILVMHDGTVTILDNPEPFKVGKRTGRSKGVTTTEPQAITAEAPSMADAGAPPEPQQPKKSGKRRGRFYGRRRNGNPVEVPLDQCEAMAVYAGARGPVNVAIWKYTEDKKPVCLFINEDTLVAYHDDGGFKGKPEKISEIQYIKPQTQS